MKSVYAQGSVRVCNYVPLCTHRSVSVCVKITRPTVSAVSVSALACLCLCVSVCVGRGKWQSHIPTVLQGGLKQEQEGGVVNIATVSAEQADCYRVCAKQPKRTDTHSNQQGTSNLIRALGDLVVWENKLLLTTSDSFFYSNSHFVSSSLSFTQKQSENLD